MSLPPRRPSPLPRSPHGRTLEESHGTNELEDVSALLGVKAYRVEYLLTHGLVPEPQLRISGRRVFTASDLEALRKHFTTKTPAARWSSGNSGTLIPGTQYQFVKFGPDISETTTTCIISSATSRAPGSAATTATIPAVARARGMAGRRRTTRALQTCRNLRQRV